MNGKQNNSGPITIGLDIGIASVGWAVLGENYIVDLGVRCFDKAETHKEGESLNLARRNARLLRRRLRHRAWRLTKLARLFKRSSLIDDVNLFKNQNPFYTSLWKLRIEALDRCLNNEEWARVIYHLCKHRGFHWISRAEEKAAESDSKSEGGKVKQGLASTKKLMQENNYRTAAEMVLSEFPAAQRNKQGDYSKALSRVLLGAELSLLFKRQRELGNPHSNIELEASIGFCPDFTDTSKKPYDRQKECLCRREENIAPSSNGEPLNSPVNRGSVVRSYPGSWVLMPTC